MQLMKIDRTHVRVRSVLMCSDDCAQAQRILEVREKHALWTGIIVTPTRILYLKFCKAWLSSYSSKICMQR